MPPAPPTDSEATRQRLQELEKQMRALSPTDDAYWQLKPERTRLRDAIDVLWLDSQKLGTRCARWAPLPWPDHVRGRWRVLRELVDAFCGVTLRDIPAAAGTSPRTATLASAVGGGTAALGESLFQWVALLDDVEASDRWERVFRDSISLRRVPDNEAYVSIMVQGEGDYHWAVRVADADKPDPPVFAFRQSLATSRFAPERTPPSYGPYGSYPSVTDFARAMIDSYLSGPIGAPHRRLARLKPGHRHDSGDVRDYGVSLRGVWAEPLVARIAFKSVSAKRPERTRRTKSPRTKRT